MDGPRGTVVITGANGFVGRHLVRAALADGWLVTALSRRTEWLMSIRSSNLKIVPWSSEDSGASDEVLVGADAVCHLAAYIPPDFTSTTYASECFRVNTIDTLDLLEASARSGVGRFVFFSSGNVYLPIPRLAKETDVVYPAHRASVYLTSKLAAEIFSESFRIAGRIPVSILRVSSVYGFGMSPHGSMPLFAKRIRQGEIIELQDGGRHAADFVDVADVVRGTLQVIDRGGDGIFNIGSGAATSMLQLAQELLAFYRKGSDLLRVLPERSGPTVIGYSGLDVTRARTELDYAPTDLRTGLRRWFSKAL